MLPPKLSITGIATSMAKFCDKMMKTQILARLRRRSAITLGVLLVTFGALWADSYFHERHFIFLPGGDVMLGFGTRQGNLCWVEYAPWSHDPKTVYWPSASIPFLYLAPFIAVPLGWYMLRKKPDQSAPLR